MDYHVRVDTDNGYRNQFVRNVETPEQAEQKALRDAEIAHDNPTGTTTVTPLD